MKSIILAYMLLGLALSCLGARAESRIKDIYDVRGARDVQVFGYGLVIGLQGTGDSLRNAPFTEQSMQAMLDKVGVSVKSGALRTKNVAAVIVVADIPTTTQVAGRFDVTVSSLGDATSLMGGSLLLTPLSSSDGVLHAVAQGQVTVTGFAVNGQAERVTQGVPTTGRISNGAILEAPLRRARDVDSGVITLDLRNADYSTVIKTVDIINDFTQERYRRKLATEQNSRSIRLVRPNGISTVRLLAEVGELVVRPDTSARIVIDSRTGTIVIGDDVRISPVAVTHGNLTVRVTEVAVISQPAPLSRGSTVVTPTTTVEAEQTGGQLVEMKGASLKGLVRALNFLGLRPSGLISILQGIKTSGALQAELVVQ